MCADNFSGAILLIIMPSLWLISFLLVGSICELFVLFVQPFDELLFEFGTCFDHHFRSTNVPAAFARLFTCWVCSFLGFSEKVLCRIGPTLSVSLSDYLLALLLLLLFIFSFP